MRNGGEIERTAYRSFIKCRHRLAVALQLVAVAGQLARRKFLHRLVSQRTAGLVVDDPALAATRVHEGAVDNAVTYDALVIPPGQRQFTGCVFMRGIEQPPAVILVGQHALQVTCNPTLRIRQHLTGQAQRP